MKIKDYFIYHYDRIGGLVMGGAAGLSLGLTLYFLFIYLVRAQTPTQDYHGYHFVAGYSMSELLAWGLTLPLFFGFLGTLGAGLFPGPELHSRSSLLFFLIFIPLISVINFGYAQNTIIRTIPFHGSGSTLHAPPGYIPRGQVLQVR